MSVNCFLHSREKGFPLDSRQFYINTCFIELYVPCILLGLQTWGLGVITHRSSNELVYPVSISATPTTQWDKYYVMIFILRYILRHGSHAEINVTSWFYTQLLYWLLSFNCWQNQYKLSSYPLYHSKYETFKVVDEIMDRGFKVCTIWCTCSSYMYQTNCC